MQLPQSMAEGAPQPQSRRDKAGDAAERGGARSALASRAVT